MRRIITGWFFTATGIMACPCHLVITLPLAVALLSGTALGGWTATHEGAIALGASIYFIGALVVGAPLLLAGKSMFASARERQPNVAITCACPVVGQDHTTKHAAAGGR